VNYPWGKLVHSGFSEPGINPGLEIHLQVIIFKGKFKTVDEILQGRSLELEISEVNHDSFSHDVPSYKNINLLEEARSFSVADLIIHIDCIVSVVDGHLNWVSGPLSVIIKGLP